MSRCSIRQKRQGADSTFSKRELNWSLGPNNRDEACRLGNGKAVENSWRYKKGSSFSEIFRDPIISCRPQFPAAFRPAFKAASIWNDTCDYICVLPSSFIIFFVARIHLFVKVSSRLAPLITRRWFALELHRFPDVFQLLIITEHYCLRFVRNKLAPGHPVESWRGRLHLWSVLLASTCSPWGKRSTGSFPILFALPSKELTDLFNIQFQRISTTSLAQCEPSQCAAASADAIANYTKSFRCTTIELAKNFQELFSQRL